MLMVISDAATVGGRIRRLRKALGYETGASFARFLGVSEQALNNWEHGRKRIGIEEASALSLKTGAPLDFIYHGSEAYLPKHLHDALMGHKKRG